MIKWNKVGKQSNPVGKDENKKGKWKKMSIKTWRKKKMIKTTAVS